MIVAVVAPMSDELSPFLNGLHEQHPISGLDRDRVSIYTGHHAGLPLVAAKTGLGKVNAAWTTQLLIDRYAVDAIIQVGLAGALSDELEIGDLILGSEYVQHDVDLTVPCGLKHGEVAFDIAIRESCLHVPATMRQQVFTANNDLLLVAEEAAAGLDRGALAAADNDIGPRVVKGVIVSGDQFIASQERAEWLRRTFQAAAAEMEGAAVAQVCQLNGVAFLGIRAISDKADHSAAVDIAAFLPVAARNYHSLVLEILRRWSGRQSSRP